MEEKDDEDATSKHCNKKEKPQTSSLLLLLLLQLPLPKQNDKKLSKLPSFRRIIVRNGHSSA
jgi:hypothetical protein